MRPVNINRPVFSKFKVPSPELWERYNNPEVELQLIGKIPALMSFGSSFPEFITAGDISEDGSLIILRGKEGKYIWFVKDLRFKVYVFFTMILCVYQHI